MSRLMQAGVIGLALTFASQAQASSTSMACGPEDSANMKQKLKIFNNHFQAGLTMNIDDKTLRVFSNKDANNTESPMGVIVHFGEGFSCIVPDPTRL